MAANKLTLKHPAMLLDGMTDKRVLSLGLNALAFRLTGTDEKLFELRNRSLWIDSRLFIQNDNQLEGWPKEYDYVLFINGYGHQRPWKLIEYKGLDIFEKPEDFEFSNGLKFHVEKGDYRIVLGQTVESEQSNNKK